MAWRMKEDSLSKLIVNFKDGNTRTFWSLDWVHKESQSIDRDVGLKRLRKLVALYGSKTGVSILYNKITDEEIERYYEGIKQ